MDLMYRCENCGARSVHPFAQVLDGGRFPPACAECGRIFDLTNAVDADEYSYGHDCEGM